jgi:hypothetical protein
MALLTVQTPERSDGNVHCDLSFIETSGTVPKTKERMTMKRSPKKELPALTHAELAHVVGGTRFTAVPHEHAVKHPIAEFAFERNAITLFQQSRIKKVRAV